MRLEHGAARNVSTRLQSDSRRRFRSTTAAACSIAAVSAVLFALLDAATIASRLGGAAVAARPMWLHTFGIAALTCVVAATALWFDSTAHTVAARVVYLATAAANLTVPLLALLQDDVHVVVPIIHCVLAALFVSMTSTARRTADDER